MAVIRMRNKECSKTQCWAATGSSWWQLIRSNMAITTVITSTKPHDVHRYLALPGVPFCVYLRHNTSSIHELTALANHRRNITVYRLIGSPNITLCSLIWLDLAHDRRMEDFTLYTDLRHLFYSSLRHFWGKITVFGGNYYETLRRASWRCWNAL